MLSVNILSAFAVHYYIYIIKCRSVSSRCSGNKLGVDVNTLPDDSISAPQLAVFATDVSRAVPVSPVMIDGVVADVVDDPVFVVADGGNTCE
jgi:hypothetical protein